MDIIIFVYIVVVEFFFFVAFEEFFIFCRFVGEIVKGFCIFVIFF